MNAHLVVRGNASCERYIERVASAGAVAKTLNELYIDGYTEHEVHPLPTPHANGPWFGALRYLIVAWKPQLSVEFDKET